MMGQSYHKKVKAAAARLKKVKVVFPGYLDAAAKRAYLRVPNLFVSPSVHESYGLNVVEAMHAGLPVLASDHYGVRDTLPAEAGRLVHYPSPKKAPPLLAAALIEMIRGRARLEAMGKAARAAAEAMPFSAAAEAVRLARASEVVILCVGNNPIGVPDGEWKRVSVLSEGREAVDRKSIKLEQEELIQQVYAANPKTVVVLISSFPYAINWTQRQVPAILHLTHNSEEEGNALAAVLFGDFDPAGRLVQTWPKSIDQLPPMMDYNIRDGRTYMYFKGTPLYPFGYGLSYTTFKYSNLKTTSPILAKDGILTASVEVSNTGLRMGEEVVQLYVRHVQSKLEHPAEELRGFQRLQLKPGENKTVEIHLPARSLAHWDTDKHNFVVEPGELELRVGASSADIRLKQMISIVN